MQNSIPSVLCALWTVPICVFVFVLFLLFIWTITPIEKDLTSTLFGRCKPQNEFSLWRCFVGDTLNSVSKQSHYITRSFSSRGLLSSCFDQWLISPSFILSLWYYIIVSPQWSTLHTADFCSCLLLHTHSCVYAVAPFEVKPLSVHPLTSQTWPGFWPHNLHMWLLR